jgi:hypothetical protein
MACTLTFPQSAGQKAKAPAEPTSAYIQKEPNSVEDPSTVLIPSTDLLYLARLCVMEVRGMSSESHRACLSVVSTALTRTENRFLSDGTLASTLGWVSGDTWQFAGYLVDGCSPAMKPETCPDNYPHLLAEYKLLIKHYLRGDSRIMPKCEHYLFYNSIPGGNAECLIKDNKLGQFIEFYKRASEPLPTPIALPRE